MKFIMEKFRKKGEIKQSFSLITFVDTTFSQQMACMDNGYDQHLVAVRSMSVDYAIIIDAYFPVGKMPKFRNFAAGFRRLPHAFD